MAARALVVVEMREDAGDGALVRSERRRAAAVAPGSTGASTVATDEGGATALTASAGLPLRDRRIEEQAPPVAA